MHGYVTDSVPKCMFVIRNGNKTLRCDNFPILLRKCTLWMWLQMQTNNFLRTTVRFASLVLKFVTHSEWGLVDVTLLYINTGIT